MSISKRMYIDYCKLQELIVVMDDSELIEFLNNRVVIPIDDESYDFLISLKDDNELIIKKIIKKPN